MSIMISFGAFMAPVGPGQTKLIQAPRRPHTGGDFEVSGFLLATEEPEVEATSEISVVAGLPEGVAIPAEVLGLIAAAKRIDVWIGQGMRVEAWAASEGLHTSWIDTESGDLSLPADFAGQVPGFVRSWLADAPEIGAMIESLQG